MTKAKESDRMRKERIAGTNNGATMRSCVVPNKKGYKRNKKVNDEDED